MDISLALSDWIDNVVKRLNYSDDAFLLAEYALHLARIMEYQSLDVSSTLKQLSDLGSHLYESMKGSLPLRPTQKIEHINNFLYDKKGFKANIYDYDNPFNNYLNFVLERKIGIPITLSIIYMAVSKTVDFILYPVNFPGHFLVKYNMDNESDIVIDPFNSGQILDDYSLHGLLHNVFPNQNVSITREYIQKADHRQVITRLLNNIKHGFFEAQNFFKAELANEMILCLDNVNSYAIRDKGIILSKKNEYGKALEMLNLYLEVAPESPDVDMILSLIRELRKKS